MNEQEFYVFLERGKGIRAEFGALMSAAQAKSDMLLRQLLTMDEPTPVRQVKATVSRYHVAGSSAVCPFGNVTRQQYDRGSQDRFLWQNNSLNKGSPAVWRRRAQNYRCVVQKSEKVTSLLEHKNGFVGSCPILSCWSPYDSVHCPLGRRDEGNQICCTRFSPLASKVAISNPMASVGQETWWWLCDSDESDKKAVSCEYGSSFFLSCSSNAAEPLRVAKSRKFALESPLRDWECPKVNSRSIPSTIQCSYASRLMAQEAPPLDVSVAQLHARLRCATMR